ncbi:MAG: NADPH-dependent FMN reductase [Acidimicrobiales bacterium]
MRVLAIPASNSPNGINRQLIGFATRLLQEGLVGDAEVEMLDLNEYEMPIYSVLRQEELGIPEEAQRFYDKIGSADAVVVSFAEHNGSYSVAWKNLYDWTSRLDIQVYQGKKVAMFATSPGSRGGAGVLRLATETAGYYGADLVGSLGIGRFWENFDPELGEISDADLRSEFEDVLRALGASG